MVGGPLDQIDDDVFYSPDDFGVEASVAGFADPVPGLLDIVEIDDDGIYARRTVFRCRARVSEGVAVSVNGTSYVVASVQPLETGEYGHVLRSV